MIKETALRYLGYQNSKIPVSLDALIDTCIAEVISLATFKHVSQSYEIRQLPLALKGSTININYPEVSKLLQDCHSCLLVACSLGIEIDRKLQYYSKIDATKMTIFDAVASSYLEYTANQWERKIEEPHTFRFCPGYGKVPLSLNSEISRVLNTYQNIGLNVQEFGILLPQKSMIGIVGLGRTKQQKECSTCTKYKDCAFIKRGTTCYSNS